MKWSIPGPELPGDSHCTHIHRIHADKGEIWDRGFPNSQLSGKYPRFGLPGCQTRWRPGKYILAGRKRRFVD